MSAPSLLDVTIDFSTSHLVFPTIIGTLLVLLGAVLAVARRHEIRAALAGGIGWPTDMDGLRFFGTLVLTAVYFLAMNEIGWRWPNRGFGFLSASMPFLFAMSVLYLHERSRRHLMLAAVVAVLAPLVAWLVLFRLFDVSLP
ncbi:MULTISPECIES: tripartite tricarboxylate transporter TctB family protein [unclassified Chelatococcus]|uniref:tripartite tricarboxylate transporter TctB family protein n=1 Tax=unclassified Chelatococcus TaxID=2638111 RepID=UPI0002D5049D|nr:MULTISPECIES: tripartite tricarboxylate transporter TctB family protein [unclassified Chelatococcus]ALA18993.1 hypothetical protein AL346_18250 [Chelatococcus sp. CO-6]